MKLLKISFYIICLLIVICVLAIAALVYFVDINKLKPVIMAEVKKQTGYTLNIDGNLNWAFFPRLAIKVDYMTLQAPNETSPFIELKNTKLATELNELIKGREKLEGHISIEALGFMNLQAQKADANIQWINKVLMINNIRASFYQGSLEGAAIGSDLMTAKPRWESNIKFNQIQLQPLLQDVNGPNSKIKIAGSAQVSIKLNTAGTFKKEILQNLNGETEFSITNGVVSGIDFNYLVQMADALLNKQAIPTQGEPNQTTFNQLTGSAIIKNGVAYTNNLLLVSSAFLINGAGDINLNDETLKLSIKIKPQQTMKTQWEIPVIISGTIKNPEVKLDMFEIEKLIAAKEIEKVKEKASAIIQKNVPGKAGKFLQNLIGK